MVVDAGPWDEACLSSHGKVRRREVARRNGLGPGGGALLSGGGGGGGGGGDGGGGEGGGDDAGCGDAPPIGPFCKT